MSKKHWYLSSEGGVEVLGFDGYEISVDELLRAPGFFVTHVAEKAWATDTVVSCLVDELVMLSQRQARKELR